VKRSLRLTWSLSGALLLASGCASHHPSNSATPHPTATGTWTHIDQNRKLACGDVIDGPVILSSTKDEVQLGITNLTHESERITVTYAVTSTHGPETLGVPIEPTPPTALLLREGRIAGVQSIPSSHPSFGVGKGFRLDEKPYAGTLTIDRVCPGTTWEGVRQHPIGYQVEVLMSRQPSSGPQNGQLPRYSPDPLTATIVLLRS